MKTRNLILAFAGAGLLGVGGYGAYWYGMNRGMQMATPAAGANNPVKCHKRSSWPIFQGL